MTSALVEGSPDPPDHTGGMVEVVPDHPYDAVAESGQRQFPVLFRDECAAVRLTAVLQHPVELGQHRCVIERQVYARNEGTLLGAYDALGCHVETCAVQ